MDDRALVLACAQGDDLAWQTLVERHGGLVYGVCQRQLDTDAAHDAAQAVFLIFARKAKDLAKTGSLSAWFVGTARNVVRNAVRETGRRQRHEEKAATMHARQFHDTPEGDLLGYLDEIIAELPRHEREVIELQFLVGIAQREIAERLNIPTGTVAIRSHRGLERLREGYRKRGVKVASTALLALIVRAGASEIPGETANAILTQTPPILKTPGRPAADPDGRIARWSKTGSSIMAIVLVSTLTLGAGALVGSVFLWIPTGTKVPISNTPHSTAVIVSQGNHLVVTGSATSPVQLNGTPHSATMVGFGAMTLRLNDPSRSYDRLMAGPVGTLLKPAATQIEPWCRGLKWVSFGSIMEGEKIALPFIHLGEVIEGASAACMIHAERRPGYEQFDEKITALTAMFGLDIAKTKNTATSFYWRGNTDGGKDLQPKLEGQDPTSDLEFLVSVGVKGEKPKDPKVHFTMHFNAQEITTKGRVLIPLPEWIRDPVDPTVFSQVPSSAIAAIAVRLKPNEGFKSIMKDQVTDEPKSRNQQKKHTRLTKAVNEQWKTDHEELAKKIKQGANVEELRKTTESMDAKGTVALQKIIDGDSLDTDEEDEDEKEVEPGFLPANLTQSFKILATSIDGHGVLWIEQQMLIPSVSMILDVPQKAAQAFIEILPKDDQASVTTGGMIVPLADGMITLRIAYKNGQILATTNPLGIESILKSDHGFTKHPIVARSLAVAGKKHGSVIALFRPTAILDQLAIPLSLAGNEDLTKAVTGYRTSLDNAPDSRAWFSVSADGEKQTAVDAEGLICAIGPLALPYFLAGSSEILKRVNIN